MLPFVVSMLLVCVQAMTSYGILLQVVSRRYINRTTARPWCPQLSVGYIQGLRDGRRWSWSRLRYESQANCSMLTWSDWRQILTFGRYLPVRRAKSRATEISAVLELLCTFLLLWIMMKLGDLQGYLLSVLAEVLEACAPAHPVAAALHWRLRHCSQPHRCCCLWLKI